MISYTKKTVFYLTLAVFLIAFDRFFKSLAINGFFNNQINLISDIFSLNFAKNYFIAFSLPITGPILNTFIILIIFGLIYFLLILIKNKEHSEIPALQFILFGAISNVFDRFKHGYVIDYFDLKYFTVFNLADVMIVSGVGVLLFLLHKKRAI